MYEGYKDQLVLVRRAAAGLNGINAYRVDPGKTGRAVATDVYRRSRCRRIALLPSSATSERSCFSRSAGLDQSGRPLRSRSLRTEPGCVVSVLQVPALRFAPRPRTSSLLHIWYVRMPHRGLRSRHLAARRDPEALVDVTQQPSFCICTSRSSTLSVTAPGGPRHAKD